MQPLSGVTLFLVALSHGKILAGELKVPASLRSSSTVGFCNRSSESAEPAAKTQDMRACGCQNLKGSVCESLQRRSRSFWVYEEKQRVATASVRWLRGFLFRRGGGSVGAETLLCFVHVWQQQEPNLTTARFFGGGWKELGNCRAVRHKGYATSCLAPANSRRRNARDIIADNRAALQSRWMPEKSLCVCVC